MNACMLISIPNADDEVGIQSEWDFKNNSFENTVIESEWDLGGNQVSIIPWCTRVGLQKNLFQKVCEFQWYF
jgi:hypothetical protein